MMRLRLGLAFGLSIAVVSGGSASVARAVAEAELRIENDAPRIPDSLEAVVASRTAGGGP